MVTLGRDMNGQEVSRQWQEAMMECDPGGMEFILWLTKIGKSRATGYRWRAGGKVATVNVDGKHFITTEEIKRFWARAAAGEFDRKSGGACKGGDDGGN
jgi:hypothetical protein